MKSLDKNYEIKAELEEVWQALVDPKIIEEWGAGPAEMSDEVGFRFKLWDGDIWGKNIKVEKNKKLVQEWFSGKWDQPSVVEFVLNYEDGVATLNLKHSSIPDGEFEDISNGWDDYYIGPMKELLEK